MCVHIQGMAGMEGKERPVDRLASAHGVSASSLEEHTESKGSMLSLLQGQMLLVFCHVCLDLQQVHHRLHGAQFDCLSNRLRVLAQETQRPRCRPRHL